MRQLEYKHGRHILVAKRLPPGNASRPGRSLPPNADGLARDGFGSIAAGEGSGSAASPVTLISRTDRIDSNAQGRGQLRSSYSKSPRTSRSEPPGRKTASPARGDLQDAIRAGTTFRKRNRRRRASSRLRSPKKEEFQQGTESHRSTSYPGRGRKPSAAIRNTRFQEQDWQRNEGLSDIDEEDVHKKPFKFHRDPLSNAKIRTWKHQKVSRSKLPAPVRASVDFQLKKMMPKGERRKRPPVKKIFPKPTPTSSPTAASAASPALKRSQEKRSEGSATAFQRRRRREDSQVHLFCDRCSSSSPKTGSSASMNRARFSDATVAIGKQHFCTEQTDGTVVAKNHGALSSDASPAAALLNINNNAKDKGRQKVVSISVSPEKRESVASGRVPPRRARALSRTRSLPEAAAVPQARRHRSEDMENWLVWRAMNPHNSVNKNPAWSPREANATKTRSAAIGPKLSMHFTKGSVTSANIDRLRKPLTKSTADGLLKGAPRCRTLLGKTTSLSNDADKAKLIVKSIADQRVNMPLSSTGDSSSESSLARLRTNTYSSSFTSATSESARDDNAGAASELLPPVVQRARSVTENGTARVDVDRVSPFTSVQSPVDNSAETERNTPPRSSSRQNIGIPTLIYNTGVEREIPSLDMSVSKQKDKDKPEDEEVVLNVLDGANWVPPPENAANVTGNVDVLNVAGPPLENEQDTNGQKRASYDINGHLRAEAARAVRFSRTSTVVNGEDNVITAIRIDGAEPESARADAEAPPPPSIGSHKTAGAGLLATASPSSPRRVSICAGQDPIGYGMSSFLSTRDSLTLAARKNSKKLLHTDPDAEMRARLTALIQEILNGKLDAMKMTHLDNFAQKLMHADESEVIGKHVFSADEDIEIIGQPPHASSDDTAAARKADRSAAGAETAMTPEADRAAARSLSDRALAAASPDSKTAGKPTAGAKNSAHGCVKFSDEPDRQELIWYLRKLMSVIIYSPDGSSFVEAIEKIALDIRTNYDDGFLYDLMVIGICILQAYQEILIGRGERGTFWKHIPTNESSSRFEKVASALVLTIFQEVTNGLSSKAYAMEDLVRITTLVSTCDHIGRSPANYRLGDADVRESTPSENELRLDEETCRNLEAILHCLESGKVTVKDLLDAIALAFKLQSEVANGPGGAGVRTQPSVVVSRHSGPAICEDRSAGSFALSRSRPAVSQVDLGDLTEELRHFRDACAPNDFLTHSINLIGFALTEVAASMAVGGDLVDYYAAIMCIAACALYNQIKERYKSNLDYKVLDKLAGQSMVESLHVAFRKLDEGWIQAADVLNLMYYVARWQLSSREDEAATPPNDGSRGGNSSSYLPPIRAIMAFLVRAMEAMKTGCASAEELRNLARFVLTIYRSYPAADGSQEARSPRGATFGGNNQPPPHSGAIAAGPAAATTHHLIRQQIEKALTLLNKDSISTDDLLDHSAFITRVLEGSLLGGGSSSSEGASAAALGDDAASSLERRIARLRQTGATTSRYTFMISILERTVDDVRCGRRVNFSYDASLLCLCTFIAYEWATAGGGVGTAVEQTSAAQPASSELDSLACAAIRETLKITLDKIRGGSGPLADLSYISGVIAATDNLRGVSDGNVVRISRRSEPQGGRPPAAARPDAAAASPANIMELMDKAAAPPRGAGPAAAADVLEMLDAMRQGTLNSNASDLLHVLLRSTAADKSLADPSAGAGKPEDADRAGGVDQHRFGQAGSSLGNDPKDGGPIGRRRERESESAGFDGSKRSQGTEPAYSACAQDTRLPPLRLAEPCGVENREAETPAYRSFKNASPGRVGQRLASPQRKENPSAAPTMAACLAQLGDFFKEIDYISQQQQQQSSPAKAGGRAGWTSKRTTPERSPYSPNADAGPQSDESQQTDANAACQTVSTRSFLTEQMARAALEKLRNSIAEGRFTQEQLKALAEILGKITDLQDLIDSADDKAYTQKVFNDFLFALQRLAREPEAAERILEMLRNLGAGGGAGRANRQMTYAEAYDLVVEGHRQRVFSADQTRQLQNAIEGKTVELRPLIGRKPLNMSSEFLSDTLSAISIKPDGCKRYSYRSLIAPNLEMLKEVKDCPEKEVPRRLSMMSCDNLDKLKMSPLEGKEVHARRCSLIERRNSIPEEDEMPRAPVNETIPDAGEQTDEDGEVNAHVIATLDFDAPEVERNPPADSGGATAGDDAAPDAANANNCNRHIYCARCSARRQSSGVSLPPLSKLRRPPSSKERGSGGGSERSGRSRRRLANALSTRDVPHCASAEPFAAPSDYDAERRSASAPLPADCGERVLRPFTGRRRVTRRTAKALWETGVESPSLS